MHKNMPVFLCDDRTGLRDVISGVVTLSQVPKLIFPLYLDAVGAEAATRTHGSRLASRCRLLEMRDFM